jgi:hypothetical protein
MKIFSWCAPFYDLRVPGSGFNGYNICGDAGFWILDLKGNYPYFIQYQVSSILPFMATTLFQTIDF